jgi:hypothetical protein
MAIFGGKSVDEKRLEYIQFIQELAKTCDLLVKHAENTEHYKRMQYIQDEVRYMLPIEKESIVNIDRKIKNALGDLKLYLRTNRDPYRVQNRLDDLELLISDRNTKI